MNESAQIDYFYDLSVVLSGFPHVKLYGTGQGTLYFNTLQDILGGELVGDLLEEFQVLMEKAQKMGDSSPEELVELELLADAKWGPVCRNIIKMWYMGNWYAMPTAWKETYVNSTEDQTKVIAGSAYIEGLVWKAMGRHPKSAKQPGYGTWAFAPFDQL